jgi:hypothetical protein
MWPQIMILVSLEKCFRVVAKECKGSGTPLAPSFFL